MSEKHPILLWRFEDAPKELQDLSPHGGDEDWLAEVPPNVLEWAKATYDDDDYLPILDSDTSFARYDYSTHEHPSKSGWQIRIGAHG